MHVIKLMTLSHMKLIFRLIHFMRYWCKFYLIKIETKMCRIHIIAVFLLPVFRDLLLLYCFRIGGQLKITVYPLALITSEVIRAR